MIKRQRTWICIDVICLGVLLMQFGCGPNPSNIASVAGEVKLDGKLLEQGSIQFLPMQGVEGSITNGEIVKGRYRISGKAGPTIGWNRVEIRAVRKTGKMVPMPFPSRGKMIEEQIEAIPPRFNSASTLKVEVKPGGNTADFEVISR